MLVSGHQRALLHWVLSLGTIFIYITICENGSAFICKKYEFKYPKCFIAFRSFSWYNGLNTVPFGAILFCSMLHLSHVKNCKT